MDASIIHGGVLVEYVAVNMSLALYETSDWLVAEREKFDLAQGREKES